MRDYEQTIISQYSGSAVLTSLIGSFNAAVDPSVNIDAFFNFVWNLETAEGYGLDVWGRIVGVPRILSVAGYGAYTLSDPAYLTLITAKCLTNISNGTAAAFNLVLMTIFPNTGDCYVTDNFDMTLTIHLPFTPNPFQAAMLALPGLLPRPAGVLINSPGGALGSLAVTILAGETITASSGGYTFPANVGTITGGSGSLTYQWNISADTHGAWSLTGATTDNVGISVSGVTPGATSAATLTLTVYDTVSGTEVTSSAASYSFQNIAASVLGVSIAAGATVSAASANHTFGGNTATPSNAVGPLLYNWTITAADANGSWSVAGASGATATPSVSGVAPAQTSGATLTVTIKDTVTGQTASASTTYSFADVSLALALSGTAFVEVNESEGYTFPPVTASASGGSGSYSYSFVNTPAPEQAHFWTMITSSNTVEMAASGVAEGQSVSTTVTVTVTDTVSGATATPRQILYTFGNNSGGSSATL